MTSRDEALASLESKDWTSAVAYTPTRSPSFVHSVRLSRELADQLAAEVARRGLTEPSTLIRQFIVEGLARSGEVDVTAQQAALTQLAERLHRAIDDAVRAA
jgi:hypothetical protein